MTEVKVRRTAGGDAAGAEGDAAVAPGVRRMSDARGRALALRRPGPLAQFRLVRMLDADAARNGAYVDMLYQLLFVAEIDGAPIPFPQSERELEALIMRLGDDGLDALARGVEAHFGEAADVDRDAVKN